MKRALAAGKLRSIVEQAGVIMSNQRTAIQRRLDGPLGLLLLVLILPLIVAALALYFVAGVLLHVVVWCCWCARGRRVLLVYSDSPIWHDYVEEQILPRVADRAIVLNWSQRRNWSHSLGTLAFRFFGGSHDYIPLAVVFRPFRRTHTLRFYGPFRDFKHGKPEAVLKLTGELFALLKGGIALGPHEARSQTCQQALFGVFPGVGILPAIPLA